MERDREREGCRGRGEEELKNDGQGEPDLPHALPGFLQPLCN